jgi:hypothetical protein
MWRYLRNNTCLFDTHRIIKHLARVWSYSFESFLFSCISERLRGLQASKVSDQAHGRLTSDGNLVSPLIECVFESRGRSVIWNGSCHVLWTQIGVMGKSWKDLGVSEWICTLPFLTKYCCTNVRSGRFFWSFKLSASVNFISAIDYGQEGGSIFFESIEEIRVSILEYRHILLSKNTGVYFLSNSWSGR